MRANESRMMMSWGFLSAWSDAMLARLARAVSWNFRALSMLNLK